MIQQKISINSILKNLTACVCFATGSSGTAKASFYTILILLKFLREKLSANAKLISQMSFLAKSF